jgi:hypothetical protein
VRQKGGEYGSDTRLYEVVGKANSFFSLPGFTVGVLLFGYLEVPFIRISAAEAAAPKVLDGKRGCEFIRIDAIEIAALKVLGLMTSGYDS